MCKSFSAKLTFERLLARMYRHVSLQKVLFREPSLTDDTTVGFVSRVDPEMKLQFVFVLNFLTANVTHNRSVDAGFVVFTIDVSLQTSIRFVMFKAYFAIVFNERFTG